MDHVSKRRALFPCRTEGKVFQSGQVFPRNVMRLFICLRGGYLRQYADCFGSLF